MNDTLGQFHELAEGLSKMLAADARQSMGEHGPMVYDRVAGLETIAMLAKLTALIVAAIPTQ